MGEPRLYTSIMVSSTFTDLEEHRGHAISAIQRLRFHAEAMEFSGANSAEDVLGKSLEMVNDAAAYVGVISLKYGQVPECPERNPDGLSLVELEFNEATRLGRPILLFVMGDKHTGVREDFESDSEKLKKLNAFRQRAKLMKPDGKINRVYEMFESPEDFALKAATAIALLVAGLKQPGNERAGPNKSREEPSRPAPPELCATPPYRGSHPLVGRKAQLGTLDDWSAAADPNPVLLFEAMGGSGKSLLTWHWTTVHAPKRREWAGRFWYSFYEKGAVMSDFCCQALSYMMGRPVDEFRKQPMSKLASQLLEQLNAKPWLIVLDGLERVLVAYHRYDAAQLRDEEVDQATDQIGKREPRRAIRREDDGLLELLAGAAPSKVLISSRLTPLALLSASDTPIIGVRQESLPGLRPEDAEDMLRACGLKGDGAAMRAYLQSNCDCHPLVIGVIAGLINKFARAPGNFDKWVSDAKGGAGLNLSKLDLVQKRNHILSHAIESLDAAELGILQLLSLFPRAADYSVLLELGMGSGAFDADGLDMGIQTLRESGLIQYDDGTGYDLHPVVRGFVSGQMDVETAGIVGNVLIDHFTALHHTPWENAKTLADLETGINLIQVLLRLGRYDEAFASYMGGFSSSLLFNLGQYCIAKELLRPIFTKGWLSDPGLTDRYDISSAISEAAVSMIDDDPDLSLKMLHRSIRISIDDDEYWRIPSVLRNLSSIMRHNDNLYNSHKVGLLSVRSVAMYKSGEELFGSQIRVYDALVTIGDFEGAAKVSDYLRDGPRPSKRGLYRPGDFECGIARELFYKNELTEDIVEEARLITKTNTSRSGLEAIEFFSGMWALEQGRNEAALKCFDSYIDLLGEHQEDSDDVEIWRGLVRFRLGEACEARDIAQRFEVAEKTAALALAELWHELGDYERGVNYALKAHKWATADGEPYVHAYWLKRTRALLEKFGSPLPEVPKFDLAAHPPFEWEADLEKMIVKYEAEAEAKADASERDD